MEILLNIKKTIGMLQQKVEEVWEVGVAAQVVAVDRVVAVMEIAMATDVIIMGAMLRLQWSLAAWSADYASFAASIMALSIALSSVTKKLRRWEK